MSETQKRSEIIRHYTEIQDQDDSRYPRSDELLSIGSPFSRVFNFEKLGIHHEELPPGRRTSFPHAESAEEEFIFVIEGTPDAWIDGYLHRLGSGDGVGFLPGTGIAHTFINNTDKIVRLLVVGEASKPENRIVYPVNPELREFKSDVWWKDAPSRTLGKHDGRPDTKQTS
jgi:uncharacterized cupin superfamily protein